MVYCYLDGCFLMRIRIKFITLQNLIHKIENKNERYSIELALIERKVDDSLVQQRLLDGYVNATALCKAAGKNFADYKRLKGTDDFLKELSSDVGIPITELIQTIIGGIPQAQGTCTSTSCNKFSSMGFS